VFSVVFWITFALSLMYRYGSIPDVQVAGLLIAGIFIIAVIFFYEQLGRDDIAGAFFAFFVFIIMALGYAASISFYRGYTSLLTIILGYILITATTAYMFYVAE
jgi:hypothetical protein